MSDFSIISRIRVVLTRSIDAPFLNTFLISLRVYATPREVIEGLHKRMIILGWNPNIPIAGYRQAKYVCTGSLVPFNVIDELHRVEWLALSDAG